MAATALAISLALIAGPPAPKCDVLDYRGWKEAPGQQWDYRWPSEGSAKLLIIGAEHVRDPEHRQFARIAAAFAELKPTIAFYEGNGAGFRDDPVETIRESGEPGYVRHLAGRQGIPARSLEPSVVEQFRALTGTFPQDQVMLFFVLRQAAGARDHQGISGAELDSAVATGLNRMQALASEAGVTLPFVDLKGLQTAFGRYWPDRPWQTADRRWFNPLADDGATGGLFTAAINRASSRYRDRHMVELIASAVRAGETSFVVVGRNHVPMQAPALACALRSGG